MSRSELAAVLVPVGAITSVSIANGDQLDQEQSLLPKLMRI
jgi:hypothetical protein